MPFNSNEIIQDICQEFEKMIKVIQDRKDATADEMERELFKRLLQMGGQLLVLFFTLRSEEQARETIENEVGEQLPYYGDKKRSYYSIFGKLPRSNGSNFKLRPTVLNIICPIFRNVN